MSVSVPTVAPGHNRTTAGGPEAASPADWDLSHITFRDVLHDMNPLQYLPVIGTIYRAITGDTVNPALRVGVATAISFVVGGPFGIAGAMLGVVADEIMQDRSAAPSATTVGRGG